MMWEEKESAHESQNKRKKEELCLLEDNSKFSFPRVTQTMQGQVVLLFVCVSARAHGFPSPDHIREQTIVT
jgi:hypothetical protein